MNNAMNAKNQENMMKESNTAYTVKIVKGESYRKKFKREHLIYFNQSLI